MRLAVDAAVSGIPLAEKAKEHPELRAALDLWGS
jgi:ribulose 1,5-bisphosphate carboxylase large subunit-like protein